MLYFLQEAVSVCYTLFPAILFQGRVTLHTSDLAVCQGELTQICEESWGDVYNEVNSIIVVLQSNDGIDGIELDVLSQNDTLLMTITVGISWTVQHVISAIATQLRNKNKKSIMLFTRDHYNLRTLNRRDTVDACGLRNGDTVIYYPEDPLLGKKPVIYLRSPKTIDALVKLALAPQWSLTAVYPVVPIKPQTTTSNEETLWQVRVHPNGDLTEISANLNVAYLYWEAESSSAIQPSPPSTPEIGKSFVEVFNPNEPDLHDANSVAVPVANITQYLEKALKALGLHLEARTSFITFWLPSILKYKFLAFRFIPQKSYECAAPLEISPTPDVITRVFMVFKGVDETELGEWASAVGRSEEDPSMWINEVGVDTKRANDATLFSVLEWGGMEIPSSVA